MTTPLRATIVKSDQCEADGHSMRAYSPVLALCRKLVEAGYDPCRPLHAYRGEIVAIRVRSIGEGASLAVRDNRLGRPIFVRRPEEVCVEPRSCDERLAA